MLKKTQETISVYFNDKILVAVGVKGGSSGAKVARFVTKDLKGVAEADRGKAIHAALKGWPVRKAEVVYVIDPSTVTTKNIEVPSTSPAEIKSIVSLQAGRHTPFSREEIQVGYVNIGVYKTSYTKILLVIANKNTLKAQLAVLEKAGLSAQKVVFPAEGVAALFSSALGLESEATPTGIIDIGRDSTNFILAFHGLAIMSRNIPIGREQIMADRDKVLEQLREELAQTIESYQADDIEQLPANYLITSDDAVAQGLQEILTQKLQWMAEVVPYTDNIQAEAKVLPQIKQASHEGAVLSAVAAGLTVDKTQVNLMPEDLQLQKSVQEQGREVFVATVCGVVILMLLACGLGLRLYFRNAFLAKLTKDYQQTHEEVTRLQEASLRADIIKRYMEERMAGLDVIHELYEKIPNQIYLTGINVDGEGNVTIQGVADAASLIYSWVTDLKASALFKSVSVESTNSKKDRGKDARVFEILLKLKDTDNGQESLETQEEQTS